jgi:hypothetical protein
MGTPQKRKVDSEAAVFGEHRRMIGNETIRNTTTAMQTKMKIVCMSMWTCR